MGRYHQGAGAAFAVRGGDYLRDERVAFQEEQRCCKRLFRLRGVSAVVDRQPKLARGNVRIADEFGAGSDSDFIRAKIYAIEPSKSAVREGASVAAVASVSVELP
jgi:hypothetical protein